MRQTLTPPSTSRSGATLTEVLMSLLIFSVGIVSVFTLFPVSLLSSIQATKLTNSKILADNINEVVRTRPSLILGGKPWLPNTTYMSNDWVFPSPRAGRLMPQHKLGLRPSAGSLTTQSMEPHWPAREGASVDERNSMNNITITWTADKIEDGAFQAFNTDFGAAYVVDPLGALLIDSAVSDGFGNNEGTLPGTHIPRRDADNLGLTSLSEVTQYFALGDSWTVEYEALPNSITDAGGGVGTDVIMPQGTDTSSWSTDAALTRVVLSNSTRTRSAVRSLTNASSGNTLVLNSDVPTSLTGPLRIEVYNRRYTWFATVNRSSNGQTLAECVVVFNRGFNRTDEELYSYSITASDVVSVSWTSGEGKPLLQEGNYCFDARTARWHRIVNIDEGASSANLVLSPGLQGSFSSGDTGSMIFLPGVVTVFQLEL